MTTTHIMSDETGQQILAQLTAISQALDDGALTNQQISTVLNDGTPTGAGFLDGGGLKTFFDGLKTKFAAITHNHSGDALTPASVAATGAVSGSSISDGTGTLAELRESVSLKFLSPTVTPGSNVTINTCSAVRIGPIVILRMQITNSSVSHGTILASLGNLPAPVSEIYCVFGNGANILPCYLEPSLNLRAAGGSSGGSWLGGVFVYATQAD